MLAIDNFSENVVLQKKYTNNIIKTKKYAVLDNVVSEKINYLKKRDLNFPLIPTLDVRKNLNLTLVIDNDFTDNKSRALLFDEKMEFRKEFEFHRKGGCWFLFSINDQSLLNIAKKTNWLESTFPLINDCVPLKSLFYEKKSNHSNEKQLENYGYKSYKNDDHFAYYKIQESFFGFTANEIGIPLGSSASWIVKVEANINNLANSIRKKTGQNIEIFYKSFKADSGVSYLIKDTNNITTFICATFEE